MNEELIMDSILINTISCIFPIIYSFIGLYIIFNIIEYFSFINLCLLFLFIIISIFFILIKSTLLYYSNITINHSLIEFTSTLFSLLFLIVIISPALIILLDFDLIILPSFIIYSSFNIDNYFYLYYSYFNNYRINLFYIIRWINNGFSAKKNRTF